MSKTLEQIKTITTYDSAYNVLWNHGCGAQFASFDDAGFSDDDICFLQNFDNFEGWQYMVVDGDYMIIREFSDDVIFSGTYLEWYNSVMEALEEDRQDRDN